MKERGGREKGEKVSGVNGHVFMIAVGKLAEPIRLLGYCNHTNARTVRILSNLAVKNHDVKY